MTTIQTIALAFGSSWISGLNLYAMVAVLGLLGRFGNLHLPGELSVLTNGWIVGIAIVLYCVEFVADKVPWVDSLWDAIHTFIRIPAGAVVAAAALGDFNRPVQVIAFMIGGGLALSSHGTKAGVRALLNLSPEPFTNIIASIIEDVIAIVAVLIAVFAPVLALVLVVIALVVTFFLLRRIISAMKRLFSKAGNIINRRRAPAH